MFAPSGAWENCSRRLGPMLKLGVCGVCQSAVEEVIRRMDDELPGIAEPGGEECYTMRVEDEHGQHWLVRIWVEWNDEGAYFDAHCEPIEGDA